MTSAALPSQTSLYQQLDAYPWAADEEFQGGLRAILGSVQDPAQIEHLTLRAKCYYYARKAGIPVDFDGYKQWIEGERSGNPEAVNGISDATISIEDDQGAQTFDAVAGAQAIVDGTIEDDGGAGGIDSAPRPASFAEICEMIAEGKTIPGIKEIPDTILEGQSSESLATKRKKPWENGGVGASADVERPSWMR